MTREDKLERIMEAARKYFEADRDSEFEEDLVYTMETWLDWQENECDSEFFWETCQCNGFDAEEVQEVAEESLKD